LLILSLLEPEKLWSPAASVFSVDLDETGNKELLFLICLGLPEVRLAEGDLEPSVAGPVAMVGVGFGPGVGLDA
jgi:hypothetical protein